MKWGFYVYLLLGSVAILGTFGFNHLTVTCLLQCLAKASSVLLSTYKNFIEMDVIRDIANDHFSNRLIYRLF